MTHITTHVVPVKPAEVRKFLAGSTPEAGPRWTLLATVHYNIDRPVILFSLVELAAPFRTGEVNSLPLSPSSWSIITQLLARGIADSLSVRLCDRRTLLSHTEHHFTLEKLDAQIGGSRVTERLVSFTERVTKAAMRKDG